MVPERLNLQDNHGIIVLHNLIVRLVLPNKLEDNNESNGNAVWKRPGSGH